MANLNREQLEVKSREEDLATSFTDNTMFVRSSGVCSSGEWKAINYICDVKSVAPHQPLRPMNTWQSLNAPQEKAVL